MGKIWGIAFIVLGIWVGGEFYTNGVHNAFGGALAWFAEPLPTGEDGEPDDRRMTQRVGDNVEGNINLGFQRKADIIDGAGWDETEED